VLPGQGKWHVYVSLSQLFPTCFETFFVELGQSTLMLGLGMSIERLVQLAMNSSFI
jgi:hypothetical protein